MLSSINSTISKIWKKLQRKAYRDGFVSAHISNTVASQIALLRSERGWTQKELAEKTGMKQSRISALEDPNYENIEVGTLRRLASAFDVGLMVRFAPFSEVVRWSAEVCENKLIVSDYANDVDGHETAGRFGEAISNPQPASRINDELNPITIRARAARSVARHTWAGANMITRRSPYEGLRESLDKLNLADQDLGWKLGRRERAWGNSPVRYFITWSKEITEPEFERLCALLAETQPLEYGPPPQAVK